MKTRLLPYVMKAMIAATALTSFGAPLTYVVSAASNLPASVTTTAGTANFGSNDNAKITIHGNEGQTMVGKKFKVYKIFSATNAAGNESIRYTWEEPYIDVLKDVIADHKHTTPDQISEYIAVDFIQNLGDHVVNRPDMDVQHDTQVEESYDPADDFRIFIEELRNALVRDDVPGTEVTVNDVTADNSIVLDKLEYGYYVIDEIQTQNNDGHSAASLCMVTTANPSREVNIKSDYPSLEKKIDEDDNDIHWNDIADYEIGQTVPYKYTSSIPNMKGYASYYYAYRDEMDPCLTFDPESVQLWISATNGREERHLNGEEFQVSENEKGFLIEITDLKRIVVNAYGEGTDYATPDGLTMNVRYNARLNEKAADKTGRPGFENKVRLEFSNNPDSDGHGENGHTPWDQTVCFTYRINGLKKNQYDKNLKGAKFELYTDAECLHLVQMKKDENGNFIVQNDAPNPQNDLIESNDEGIFNIIGLDQGTYYLKEVEAPAGYRLLEEPIKMVLTPEFVEDRNQYEIGDGQSDRALKNLKAQFSYKEGVFDAEAADGFGHTVNGFELPSEGNLDDGSVNLSVTNTSNSLLPSTGSAVALTVMVVTVAGGGLYLFLNRRKENKE